MKSNIKFRGREFEPHLGHHFPQWLTKVIVTSCIVIAFYTSCHLAHYLINEQQTVCLSLFKFPTRLCLHSFLSNPSLALHPFHKLRKTWHRNNVFDSGLSFHCFRRHWFLDLFFKKNHGYNVILINPFPHIDAFWRLCSRRMLKTLGEKEILLKTSNLSFCKYVFNFYQ